MRNAWGGVPRTRVPGDLVFYEGANIENRTKIFLKLEVDVVAIELQDEYVNILESSFDKNKHLQSLKRFLGFGRRS